MTLPSPDLAAKLAGYIVNRRDKRAITFGVLGLYAASLLYHFVGPAFGAPGQKTALDSIETLALVVVIAHIAGGVAQRAIAQRAVAQRAVATKASTGEAPVSRHAKLRLKGLRHELARQNRRRRLGQARPARGPRRRRPLRRRPHLPAGGDAARAGAPRPRTTTRPRPQPK